MQCDDSSFLPLSCHIKNFESCVPACMLIKVNTLLVYHEYTSDPLACKINHTVEVASITNSLNPFSVTRMTPKFLFLFSLAPHTLRFALAKSFTGCDLSLKPLGSPTLTHKTHTHTHTHTHNQNGGFLLSVFY